MEQNQKNSVIVYHDWLEAFEALSDEEAKQLIIAILNYSIAGAEPSISTVGLKMAWSFIKPTIQRDKEKYIKKCQKNAENGKKGGRPKNQTVIEKNERFSEKPKKADNDNDNESESDIISPTHAYGSFCNVFLTDEEYQDLNSKYSGVDTVIEELSAAKAAYPGKYDEGNTVALIIKFLQQKNKDHKSERRKLLK